MLPSQDFSLSPSELTDIKREIVMKVFDGNQVPRHRVAIGEQRLEYHSGGYHFQVAELKNGAAFGELALLAEDGLR